MRTGMPEVEVKVWGAVGKAASARSAPQTCCDFRLGARNAIFLYYSQEQPQRWRGWTMNKRLAVLLLLAASPWVQSQQSANTTFKVSARVNAVCEITATDLAFGTYTAQSGTPLQGTTVLKATCTPNSTYNIGLNEGTSPGATVNQRRMVSGTTGTLNYQLYSDASRSAIWGNTTGTDTVTGTGTGLAQDHTVFGQVPAAQVVPAGDYADIITVRIYY
jgi:spore coat protein U-like protein